MANTVDIQILEDDRLHVFALINVISDGSGNVWQSILDPATFSPPCAEYRLLKVRISGDNGNMQLYWTATSSPRILAAPWATPNTSFDFSEIGGLKNWTSTGKTGAMTLSIGFTGAYQRVTIYLKLLKVGVS